MMRVPPCDDPLACGSVKRSRPSTVRPRAASSASVAAPITPSPTTIASYVIAATIPEIEGRADSLYTARTRFQVRWTVRAAGGGSRMQRPFAVTILAFLNFLGGLCLLLVAAGLWLATFTADEPGARIFVAIAAVMV